MNKIKRALISVSDKEHIVEFARQLQQVGIEILSTGGTAKTLSTNGITVIDVSSYTGFPEMMQGRVKTLHPKIHGGILARRGIDEQELEKSDILPIDLVVVNLYPFQETVSKPGTSLQEAIENIDIGGPSMIRAAAKNFSAVAVVVDKTDYDDIIKSIQVNQGAIDEKFRFSLAKKAFMHTSEYDTLIANYLNKINQESIESLFPNQLQLQFHKSMDLRYGENPHQKSAFYTDLHPIDGCISSAEQLQGKALSYNNIMDTDAALECVKQFEQPACVIVKHANPCGVAIADDLLNAYNRAYSTDPTSAFGGIIAFNGEISAPIAKLILERQFVEVIIAPSVHPDAIPILREKSNVRVLVCGSWSTEDIPRHDYRRVNGGLLVQDQDIGILKPESINIVSKRQPSENEMNDLLFAWKVVKFVKSNAIVYCKDQMTIGIGAGQMSRVYSARIAAIKAQDENLHVTGSVMASDAFFPFRDGIDSAAQAGISCVIQPGGSMRDPEVIAAADEHGMAMVFTGMRHFRH